MPHLVARMRPLGIVLLVCYTMLLSGCGVFGSSAPATPEGMPGPSEIAVDPVAHQAKNPFTPSVGEGKTDVKPPTKAVGGGVRTYEGGTAGLYGGTLNLSYCDAAKLVDYLEHNSDKASAWAQAIGISTSDIHTYVFGLTSVLLRVDTRVTNNDYYNGHPVPYQDVLQAGTAVMVDHYGVPRVRCYCGNPLAPPIPIARPVYIGPRWPAFSPTTIVIIKQSITIINTFTLADPTTDALFTRPVGTSGGSDVLPTPTEVPPTQAPPTEVPPTEVPPTEAPPVEPPTQAPAQTPAASFSPNPGQRGDDFTLSASGFSANVTLSVSLVRPDGVTESYSIETGPDGSGTHVFTNTGNVVTGVYTATITDPVTGAQATASVQVNP